MNLLKEKISLSQSLNKNGDQNNNKKIKINQLFLIDKSKQFQPKVLIKDILQETTRSYKSKNKAVESIVCTICNKRFAFQYILTDHMKRFHERVKKLSCSDCDLKFFSLRELIDHKWRHTGKKPFNCTVCNLSFIRQFNMMDHLNKIHGEKLFTCKICCEKFKEEINLKYHQRVHLPDDKKFTCIICDKLFKKFENRITHEQTHIRAEMRCVMCPSKYLFPNCAKLREHITKNHTDFSMKLIPKKKNAKKSFHCSVCDEYVLGEVNFRYHSRSHLPDDLKFVCQTCPKSFMTKSALRNHQSTHNKNITSQSIEEPFRCKICLNTYSSELFLRKHENLRHQIPNLLCDICHKCFRTKNDLKYHRRSHLPASEQFKCNLCPFIFLESSTLRNHKETHNPEKRFKCEFCGINYKTKDTLGRHKKVLHALSGSSIACDICGITYSSMDSLTVHKRNVHKVEKRICFQCQVCHKNYSTRNNLERHQIRQNHRPKLTSKFFFCSICDEIYTNEKTYKEHQKSHESYKCLTCLKVFALKETLQLHEESHLSRNYECEICLKTFKYREQLIKHQLEHDEEAEMTTQRDLEEFISETMDLSEIIDPVAEIDPLIIVEADGEILDMDIWQLSELLDN